MDVRGTRHGHEGCKTGVKGAKHGHEGCKTGVRGARYGCEGCKTGVRHGHCRGAMIRMSLSLGVDVVY